MSFTSSLYIRTNNRSDEKVCVGLFAIDGDRTFFDFSESKVKVADSLIEDDISKLIISSLRKIKDGISGDDASKLEFGKSFNLRDMEYLNKYSKGLYCFDTPKPISVDINSEVFGNLYQVFVGFEPKKRTKMNCFEQIIMNKEELEDLIFDKFCEHNDTWSKEDGNSLTYSSFTKSVKEILNELKLKL